MAQIMVEPLKVCQIRAITNEIESEPENDHEEANADMTIGKEISEVSDKSNGDDFPKYLWDQRIALPISYTQCLTQVVPQMSINNNICDYYYQTESLNTLPYQIFSRFSRRPKDL